MSESSTESSILNNIPDFRDDTGGSNDATTTDTSQATTSTPATTGTDEAGRSSAAPTTGGSPSGGTDNTGKPAVVQRRHDGLIEVPNKDNPNTRDLVDPVSGRTVAQGGIERRVFEEGQRHARENNQLRTQLTAAQRTLSSINEVTQEAVKLGVAPQDQVIAIRVMADFMRDPVKTLESLVAEVKSKGYTIPFLEQGINPGMDLSAIQRMIDAKMAPITNQQQQQQVNARARAEAQTQLDTFLSENPDANENLDVISGMINNDPKLTLHGAYTRMIRWAHANQLDWTRSLREQVASQQQPTNQTEQPTQANQQQQESRPLPGRRSAGAGQPRTVNGGGQPMNENASWSDIIREAMREHNVSLN